MAIRNYYQIAVRHQGLGKYRMIRGSDKWVVEAAAAAQQRTWNELYAKKLAAEERRQDREDKRQELEDSLREADDRTREAQAELNTVRSILSTSLRQKERIDWDKLKHLQPFSQPQPAARPYLPYPAEPRPEEVAYQPKITIMGKLIHSVAEKREQDAAVLFANNYKEWQERTASLEATNQEIYSDNLLEFENWRKQAAAFETARAEHNEAIDRMCVSYQAMQPDAIIDYCELVLSQSKYPDCCPKDFEMDFQPATKTLVVDYQLPSPDDLPNLTEVKFVRTKGDFIQSELTKKQFDQLYEDVVFQIALRTIHELLREDSIRAISKVAFNGTVKAIDPGTGNLASRCILSVQAGLEQFLAVNLLNVQPRACFEALGGAAGKKLSDLKKVSPKSSINLNDQRFSAAETISSESASALNEWQELVKSISDHSLAKFLKIESLARIVGFPPSEKYSAALSRELAGMVAARGFGIEPDARFGAAPYQAVDEVTIFRPINPQVTRNYLGAAVLLKLCMMIAAADDDIQDAELKVVHDVINQNASLDDGDKQRLAVLELLLRRNPGTAKRSLSRISKRLPVHQRNTIGEVLVYVAAADGKITSAEWVALDRSFKALDLSPSALDDTLHKLGAQFTEPTVQEAEAGIPGEPLPTARPEPVQASAPAFTIDMTKVARISQETSEVIGILSAVMDEDDVKSASATKSTPSPASSPEVPSTSVADPEDVKLPSSFDSLNTLYRPIIPRLLAKSNWSRIEFGQLASEFKLMPLGLFDALNEWADENLGDFLLDGEDPITVNQQILSKEPSHE